MVSVLESEMRDSTKVIERFDESQALDLASKITSDTIYIVGSGSSMLFPGKHAYRRAEELNLDKRIVLENPENIRNIPEGADVIVVSNSGRTGDAIKFVDGRNVYAFTRKDTELSKLVDKAYLMDSGEEGKIPATKSVVEQALFMDAFVHGLADVDFRVTKRKYPLATQVLANLDKDVDVNFTRGNVYWIDFDTGVGEELALKTTEIVGKPLLYFPGMQIKHGIVEGMGPGDIVIAVGAHIYGEDRLDEIADAIGEAGAKLVTMEETKFENLGLAYGVDNPYSQLTRGWKAILNLARVNGRGPDHPRYLKDKAVR